MWAVTVVNVWETEGKEEQFYQWLQGVCLLLVRPSTGDRVGTRKCSGHHWSYS